MIVVNGESSSSECSYQDGEGRELGEGREREGGR